MSGSSATDFDEEAFSQQHPELYDSLIPLLKRSEPHSLEAYLKTVACNVAIENTRTQAHCYFVSLDGNRRPRVDDFAEFIGKKITGFAIPRTEVVQALKEADRTQSTFPIDSLTERARSLFTRLPNSGEGGEVLLSVLAETFLRLPQLFTKMVLKTNAEMHVHGSDGIHVGVNRDNGNLAVYWGESKLHGDATEAVTACFSSLSPFLLGPAQRRDLQLMRDHLDLNDSALVDALKHYLDPDDPMFNRMEYRGLCLVGFDSGLYPNSPNSKEAQAVKKEIEISFESNRKHILKRVNMECIESFVIEVFCLPFPSVDEFRRAFRTKLGLASE